MTLGRANAGGWVDGTDPLTPAQVNHMGAEYELALDGQNGGNYSPSAAIILQGRLTFDTGTGKPSMTWRRPASVASMEVTGSMSIAFDSYLKTTAVTSATDLNLDHTTRAPASGDSIQFTRGGNGGDTNTLTTQRSGGTDLVTFSATNDGYARYVWDGSNWRTLEWGGAAATLVTV